MPTPKVFGPGQPKLYDRYTNADIYWSPSWERNPGGRWEGGGGCNSYVLRSTSMYPRHYMGRLEFFLLNGQPVCLTSINGQGEARWEAEPARVRRYAANLAADPTLADRPWEDSDGRDGYLAFKHFEKGGLRLPPEE